MSKAIKNTIFWNHKRTSWQFDVLSILILSFIFLTPKSWFEGRSRALRTDEIRSATLKSVVLDAQNYDALGTDEARMARLRELSGMSSFEIIEWREKRGGDGKIIGYEAVMR